MPETATPDATCEPLCLENWECGPDGCGGTCGLCGPNDECNAAKHTCEPSDTPDAGTDTVTLPFDPMVCTGSISDPQPFGGSCCYTPVAHPDNPNCVWYADNYGSGACVHAQCDTGYCERGDGYCSKPCTLTKDIVDNATGDPGADGIEDPETTECGGAVDGPGGTVFRCVNQNEPNQNPQSQCRAGTTFASCNSNKDCSNGETCQLYYIHGLTQARCGIPTKGAASGTEECNSDPNSGAIQRCSGPFCFGAGCVDLCADNSDCLTDTCDETTKTCTKDPSAACEEDVDCSAWECQEITPYNNSTFKDEFCQTRSCKVVGDCKDPDWFCRPFWNGADKVEDVAFAPSCRRKDVGTVAYGQSCGVDGDGTGLPACVWSGGCIDNICSGPCQNDSDCGDGLECLLGYEWNIDIDDDNNTDTTVNVDLCQLWPHEGDITTCTTDADCPADHHCQYRIKGEGDGADRVWKAQYVCRSNYDEQVGFGEVCGGASGKQCASDLCLVPSSTSGEKSMCTSYCTSSADCPDNFVFEEYGYKSVCLSFNVNNQNSPDTADDVYVPYCWRTSPFASVDSCEETRKCAKPKEYCRPFAIGGNPDEKVTVEHLCIDQGNGLSSYPTKEDGDSCTNSSQCKSRSCAPDGNGGGFCSSLCVTDSDCANDFVTDLVCSDVVVMARPDKDNSGYTKRCLREAMCTVCATDDDCGGSFVCANFGGIGLLADFRCGKPCDVDSDSSCVTTCDNGFCNQDPTQACTAPADCDKGLCSQDNSLSCDVDGDCSACVGLDPASTCSEDFDDKGIPKDRNVCMPDLQCPAT